MQHHQALVRAAALFCERLNLRVPILMAPMAVSAPPSLAAAVANAGGLGACGALHLQRRTKLKSGVRDTQTATNGSFQLNLWVPNPPVQRDALAEESMRAFLRNWGPEVPLGAGDFT